MPADITSIDDEALARAARILSEGGLVAIPSETVYGLAADATNGLGVEKFSKPRAARASIR